MAFLTAADLVTVKGFLFNAKKKWYNIGLELGVKAEKLDQINDEYGFDYDACLRQMLRIWLKFYHNRPSWNQLADALKQEAVDEDELADEGMAVYFCFLWQIFNLHWWFGGFKFLQLL